MATYAAYRDNGKTNEEGLFKWLHRLFTGGVDATNRPTSLKVTQRGAGANMSVDIAVGDISIDLTDYTLWGWSTAIVNNVVTAADATNARKDIVVAYIDMAVTDAVNSNNPGALKFKIVAGTPSATPVDPSGATIQASVGPGNPYKMLARITLPANATTVVDAYIADLRPQLALKARLWGGSSNTSGHVVPNVADDVVLLESATQGVRNKTFYDPVIDNPQTTGDLGWQSINTVLSVASGYNKGNKQYVLDSSVDVSNDIPVGAKLKLTRGTTAPTQCADFEASSTQYAVKTSPAGLSFTDDFTPEGWIKMESLPASAMSILSCWNGTSGWDLRINTQGQLSLSGFNAGSSNESFTIAVQSIPQNRWIHVAACLDMSTFTPAGSPIYIDGSSVPVTVGRSGSNPTTLIQAGNLEMGSRNGGLLPFDGKMSDIRLWNVIRTATQIRDNMNKQLVGNETNLVGYWKLNGNFNDSTTNANNLTAMNSASPSASDNPAVNTEYAIVTKVTSTQITVFTGTDHNIPNMALSNPQYSLQRTPFGFPSSPGKWVIETHLRYSYLKAVGSPNTFYVTPVKINLPLGAWLLGYKAAFRPGGTTFNTAVNGTLALTEQTSDYAHTSAPTEDEELSVWVYSYTGNDIAIGSTLFANKYVEKSADSVYSFAARTSEAAGSYEFTLMGQSSGTGYHTVIRAQCAYV